MIILTDNKVNYKSSLYSTITVKTSEKSATNSQKIKATKKYTVENTFIWGNHTVKNESINTSIGTLYRRKIRDFDIS